MIKKDFLDDHDTISNDYMIETYENDYSLYPAWFIEHLKSLSAINSPYSSCPPNSSLVRRRDVFKRCPVQHVVCVSLVNCRSPV